MPSIESIGHPLVFKAGKEHGAPAESGPDRIAIRSEVRTLENMQKEAIVHYGPTGTVWRMVSDEGPYLNGSDLAPFPLAFYTAGMVFCFMSEVLKHAKTHRVEVKSLSLTSDHFYTMEGSAIRGDMTGGAKSVELEVRIEANAPKQTIAEIVKMAKASSPAEAYMCNLLQNTFALSVNGRELPVARVKQSPSNLADDPLPKFDTIQPQVEGEFMPGIITKVSAAEVVHGVEGGAGSSLKSEQKRTLHVHSWAKLLDGALKEAVVKLVKPMGSTFRFLSDETAAMGGTDCAPPGLAYLSAGIGFCYMTQLGRYARIVKQDLESYRIVQDNIFRTSGTASDWSATTSAEPVDTHVFVTCDEPDEAVQQLVSMGEQTCFLHAAMRSSHPTHIHAEINGEEVALN